MFNYVEIEFPTSNLQPTTVHYAYLFKDKYKHEMAHVKFRDWDVDYTLITPGSPVFMRFSNFKSNVDFYGYVHHIEPNHTPGTNQADVYIMGASYLMKNPSQKVWKNVSADMVIKKIAAKYNFFCQADAHPRVYPQIAQAGHSEWEFMVRLAKQSGYSLRTENTELYFQPVLKEYTTNRNSALVLRMQHANHPGGTDIYSFNPMIGEDLDYEDSRKSGVAVGGLDGFSTSPISVTKQIRNNKTRSISQIEFFDHFDTSSVVIDSKVAKHVSDAHEELNSFPYRAKVEIAGNPSLRPDLPVFLDGVGSTYSGYWTILGVEHRVVEGELNRQVFTTVLEVGTDSLGEAIAWTDNKLINMPETTGKRVITPGVFQTQVSPGTILSNPSVSPNPQTKGPIGSLVNRANTAVIKSPPLWKTTTPTASTSTTSVSNLPGTITRLQGKGLL